MRTLSGKTGVVWVRTSEEGEQQFTRASGSARMLYEEAGAAGVDPQTEWFTKPHVLVQYGSYAHRYNIGDVSFSAQ